MIIGPGFFFEIWLLEKGFLVFSQGGKTKKKIRKAPQSSPLFHQSKKANILKKIW